MEHSYMAFIYSKEYTKEELLARVGDISQIARIKPYRLEELKNRSEGAVKDALDIRNTA
jgi:hypothetical protein